MPKSIERRTITSTKNSVTFCRGAVPSQTDWAYLAGVFDGEGCISISAQKRKTTRVAYVYYQLRFVITNTSYALLEHLATTFGGSIHVHASARRMAKKQWRAQYQWHVESREDILVLVNGMLPYLKYKHTEAGLTVEFFSGWVWERKGALGNEEAARREGIVKQIRAIPGRRGRYRTGKPSRTPWKVLK